LARFVSEVVEALDHRGELSAFYARYRSDGWGRAAYHPAMMVKVLLYGYCQGVRSSLRCSPVVRGKPAHDPRRVWPMPATGASPTRSSRTRRPNCSWPPPSRGSTDRRFGSSRPRGAGSRRTSRPRNGWSASCGRNGVNGTTASAAPRSSRCSARWRAAASITSCSAGWTRCEGSGRCSVPPTTCSSCGVRAGNRRWREIGPRPEGPEGDPSISESDRPTSTKLDSEERDHTLRYFGGRPHTRVALPLRLQWCRGRESNPHGPGGPEDF